ncbi:MAG: hypothetical protein JOY71_11300 [Acetobacteraceae bacterium]|nr:hypothetical protein [Acetobacteraceae bacterium]
MRLTAGDHVSLLALAAEHQVPVQKIQERLELLEEWGHIRIRRNASGMTTIIIPETGKALRIRMPKAVVDDQS